jgi:hypothetical protein
MPASAFFRALALDRRVNQARRELVYIYGMQLRRHDLDAQFRVLAERGPLTRDKVMTWCLALRAAVPRCAHPP